MAFLSDGAQSSSKGCPKDLLSEMKGNFQAPFLKRPTPTRNKRLEQFLWQELYDEYIRHHTGLAKTPIEKANSEYYDEYCKDVPQEDLEAKEVLINRYPLHSTSAITVYNQNGDITKDFKKHYTITCPVGQQREQFG